MRLLKDATLITAGKVGKGSILIDSDRIKEVWWADSEDYGFKTDMFIKKNPEAEISDLTGKHVIAGGIDAHVHFREPGLTHKADIATESLAAAADAVAALIFTSASCREEKSLAEFTDGKRPKRQMKSCRSSSRKTDWTICLHQNLQ